MRSLILGVLSVTLASCGDAIVFDTRTDEPETSNASAEPLGASCPAGVTFPEHAVVEEKYSVTEQVGDVFAIHLHHPPESDVLANGWHVDITSCVKYVVPGSVQ